jgi:hypothetical protein
MTDLHRALLELLRSSDGLLLPDKSVIDEISKKQHELEVWDEEIVLQGLITMKELLQELANQNQTYLVHAMDEMEWGFREQCQNPTPEVKQIFPSVWELARHLSNWIIVFIPPLRALDLRGDRGLVSCLESPDHHVATLATIMLGCEEFNFVGSIEKFSEILNQKCQTSLQLEIRRLLYTRYNDLHALRKEIVPNLITSDRQYDIIFESDIQRKRLLSCIRELAVWDIATKGKGPRRKWATWWI